MTIKPSRDQDLREVALPQPGWSRQAVGTWKSTHAKKQPVLTTESARKCASLLAPAWNKNTAMGSLSKGKDVLTMAVLKLNKRGTVKQWASH